MGPVYSMFPQKGTINECAPWAQFTGGGWVKPPWGTPTLGDTPTGFPGSLCSRTISPLRRWEIPQSAVKKAPAAHAVLTAGVGQQGRCLGFRRGHGGARTPLRPRDHVLSTKSDSLELAPHYLTGSARIGQQGVGVRVLYILVLTSSPRMGWSWDPKCPQDRPDGGLSVQAE